MDALVSRYSQPAAWEETVPADEQDELLQMTPKFRVAAPLLIFSKAVEAR